MQDKDLQVVSKWIGLFVDNVQIQSGRSLEGQAG